jgi:hypothetical protein
MDNGIKKRNKLTYDFCKEVSSKHDSLSSLRKEGGVMNKIINEGWVELISHIKTEYEKRIMEFDESKSFEPYEYYLNYSTKDISGEIWIDINGYEGLYKVSNIGRVKSLEKEIAIGRTKPETIKRSYKNHKGYLKVQLNNKGKHRSRFVHRLVLENFTLESKLEVNHKNMVKTDNRLENLEYVTGKENVNHATMMTGRVWKHTMGGNHHGARRILGIDLGDGSIKYDIPFVHGVYEYLPKDKLDRDLRRIIKNCLKNKNIYIGCCWVYYEEYKNQGVDLSLFKEPKHSKEKFLQNKEKAFLLFKEGKRPSEVSKITKIPENSVLRYWKGFKMENGI